MPDTLMDLTRAQDEYPGAPGRRGRAHARVDASPIGVGNMIPAWVKTILRGHQSCRRTKLSDRGSAQAIGVVTDVGLFLRCSPTSSYPPGLWGRTRSGGQIGGTSASGSGDSKTRRKDRSASARGSESEG